MPEGSQDTWAGPHTNAMAGAARSTIRGINNESTRDIVKTPRAAAEMMNGLTLLDSRILAPCQEAGRACPRQEIRAMEKARITLTTLVPEYCEYWSCSSNNL